VIENENVPTAASHEEVIVFPNEGVAEKAWEVGAVKKREADSCKQK
jgi:hypothetical protein